MNANSTVRWLENPKPEIRWLSGPGDGTLGDPYTDCMSACLDKCNNAGFTEPGALQACVAACPTTCFLYKVPPGGTPNKPTDCMTKCLADANALSDPTARAAAIAACPATCKLVAALKCPAGQMKDPNDATKCVPISANIGCATDKDCPAGKECFQGLCVDKCPTGQEHDSSGACVPKKPVVTTAGMGNWGILLLAGATAGALWFAFRGAGVTAGP